MAVKGAPRHTRIMGQRFTIGVHKNLAVEHPSVVGQTLDILGMCDNDSQMIALDPEQGPDKLRETYLHEHLHAMVGLAGMRDMLGTNEEDVVKRLSPILLQFLRDNPRVYTFLTGGPK